MNYSELFTSDHSMSRDPTPQSNDLSFYLHKLDESLIDIYRTHPALQSRHYSQPVFPPTLTPSQSTRYQSIHNTSSKYLFTSILLNVEPILPDIFQSLLVAVDFLGPQNFGVSIVEGPSSDGTDILFEKVLAPLLLEMGVDKLDIHLNTRRPSAKFGESNRIEKLAKLREEPLLPLRQAKRGTDEYNAVVYFNDVYFSGAMLMELVFQHANQGSDVTCAWDLLWKDEFFYDIWVARDIHTGDVGHLSLSSFCFLDSDVARGWAFKAFSPYGIHLVTVLQPLPDISQNTRSVRRPATFPGLLVLERDSDHRVLPAPPSQRDPLPTVFDRTGRMRTSGGCPADERYLAAPRKGEKRSQDPRRAWGQAGL